LLIAIQVYIRVNKNEIIKTRKVWKRNKLYNYNIALNINRNKPAICLEHNMTTLFLLETQNVDGARN